MVSYKLIRYLFKNKNKVFKKLKVFYFKGANFIVLNFVRIKKIPLYTLKGIKKLLPDIVDNKLTKKIKYLIKSTLVKETSPRFYIKKGVSIESFFEEIKKNNVRYVVLRWWEELPQVEVNEDIDILIHSDDHERILQMLDKKENGQKIDIYTNDGKYGCGYEGLIYYPKHLSDDILDSRVLHKGLYFVPNDYLYFISLAYHAIYHKCDASGLKGFGKICINIDHDYERFLSGLALKLGLDVGINADALVEFIMQKGYAPPPDLQTKLSLINNSVKKYLPKIENNPSHGEYTLLVVRSLAVEQGFLDLIKEIVTVQFKMDIVISQRLDKKSKEFLAYNMRGGNWSRGPYHLSGGEPFHILVVYDYFPARLNSKYSQDDSYKFFTNQNFIILKNTLRKKVNENKYITSHYNAVHTTDNQLEADFFLSSIFDNNNFTNINKLISECRESYYTAYNVSKLISHGRRSKVELIEYEGGSAVKKTFRIGYEEFFKREVFAYKVLSKKILNIPLILFVGKNYIITEFIDEIDDSPIKVNLLSKRKGEILSFLRNLYNNGYAHLNFTPSNVILSKDHKIYVIDFEFLHKYDITPPNFIYSYDIVGVPRDFYGDLPLGYDRELNTFYYQWHPYFGGLFKSLTVDDSTNPMLKD